MSAVWRSRPARAEAAPPSVKSRPQSSVKVPGETEDSTDYEASDKWKEVLLVVKEGDQRAANAGKGRDKARRAFARVAAAAQSVGQVQADPSLKVPPGFRTLTVKRITSAFNLNPPCLSELAPPL